MFGATPPYPTAPHPTLPHSTSHYISPPRPAPSNPTQEVDLDGMRLARGGHVGWGRRVGGLGWDGLRWVEMGGVGPDWADLAWLRLGLVGLAWGGVWRAGLA